MFEGEAATLRLFGDPDQRDMSQGVVRVAAADIRMHADEPDLAEPLVLDPAAAILVGRGGLFVLFRPQHRMERGALVIQREGVAGTHDAIAEDAIGQFQRPQPTADAARHFVDRQARRPRPYPKDRETRRPERPGCRPCCTAFLLATSVFHERRWRRGSSRTAVQSGRCVLGPLGAIGAVGGGRARVQLALRHFGRVSDETLLENEAQSGRGS